ncbi:molybdopterin molybdotransferase MoeA [Alphaproteobacteria bacterium]|nr:molybdopterin molybdotransferase MoeA [Alphaproteobacteria bacterium]
MENLTHKSKLLSLNDAIDKIKSNFKKIGNEDVFLQNANGRCLSKSIVSKRNNPNFDASSMDGFAVNTDDYNNLKKKVNIDNNKFVSLKIIGESSAGTPYNKNIKSGEVVQIYTGAKLPSGSDAVIIQENVNLIDKSNYIKTNVTVQKNQNVRKEGLDFKIGQHFLSKGTIINARHLGAIAMTGTSWVTVTRKPLISILSTGNEIKKVGEQLLENHIPSGNNLMLAALIQEFGGIPRILETSNDDELSISNIINDALDSDLIVTTGGVSVGKYDLIQKSLLNFTKKSNEFWKIAMRPGKPLLFSKINNTPLLGLPGNPVSTGVCALIFVNIAIKKMLGNETSFPEFEKITLEGSLKNNDERMDFLRAKIKNIDGHLFAIPFERQDSSMINQFSSSDCLIIRDPFERKINNGELVKVIRFQNNI